MSPFPTDPMQQHQRHFNAFLADLASGDLLRAGKTPRADRVAEIAKAMREAEGR